MAELKIEHINIKDLKPYVGNPRKHPPEAVEKLKKSIEQFGWTNPILVDKDGRVLAGHARIKAAEKANINTVPVVRLPLSGKKAELYVIADNKTAELTEWDWPKLGDLFSTLDDGSLDLELSGFELDEIGDLMHGLDEKEVEQDEVPEVPEEAITKPGDLWIMGEHRLLCGDCTKEGRVGVLLGGEKIDLVFTDPPYGINWNTDYTNLAKGKARHCRNAFEKIQGDNIKFNVKPFLGIGQNHFFFGGNYFSDQLPCGGWVIWDKSHDSGNYLFTQAEGCWTDKLNAVRIFKHKWQGHDRESERGEKTAHPTQKPIKLVADILGDIFKDSVCIYDPFVGSGTTIIAAEQLNRKCYAMEIEPKYCDVAVKRWENFTGKKAVLEAA